MITQRKCGIVLASACMAAALCGCALPEGGYGFPPPADDLTPARYALAPYDGCWSFYDAKNSRSMNLVETLDENTLLVTPLGRAGGTRQYVRIGETLYQDSDGPGTYQFAAGGGVWRSNDKRNITLRLTHEGRSC